MDHNLETRRGGLRCAGHPIGTKAWAALFVICCLSITGHLICFSHLPDYVPSHWGLAGTDGWMPRSWTLPFDFMPLAALVALWAIPRIDPHGSNFDRFGRVYLGITCCVTVALLVMTWIIDIAVFALAPQVTSTSLFARLFYAVVGTFFLVLGNFLPRVKQNYFIGCRTPWALNDERNWFLTHRFAGVATIVMGAAYLISALIGPMFGYATQAIIVATTVIGKRIIVFLYSFLVFCNGNRPIGSSETER